MATPRLEHGATLAHKTQGSRVAAPPVPDKHDPARAVREDYENVLLEAGFGAAVALLHGAGRGPRCYFIDARGRALAVLA
jgi:hypothetical protein